MNLCPAKNERCKSMWIKSKKAFTLIEMIVVVALVGIVGLGVVSMMVPASNVFTRMSKEVEAKMKASEVMQILVPQIRFAEGISVLDDYSMINTTDGNRFLYTRDGKVYLSDGPGEKDLFGENFYGNYQVGMTADILEDNLLQIDVTVELKGSDPNIKSTLTTAVRQLNDSAKIIGQNGGMILSYKWGPPA